MRRLCLTLLCGLIAVPAALAAAHATGDGVLELKGATGVVTLTASRGSIWGQMDKGTLVVQGDGPVFVSGAESVTPGKSENTLVYGGKDLHFRVGGSKVRLKFKGSGVDLTAVGVGSVQLTGDAFAYDTGRYAVDSGKWITVPVMTKSVPFGVQPAPAP